jgi:hypothetical protein
MLAPRREKRAPVKQQAFNLLLISAYFGTLLLAPVPCIIFITVQSIRRR